MQDQAALTAHSIFELAQQARLVDPGVATDNQRAPDAHGLRFAKRGEQTRQLGSAPDEKLETDPGRQ